jgi:hypothetical protein
MNDMLFRMNSSCENGKLFCQIVDTAPGLPMKTYEKPDALKCPSARFYRATAILTWRKTASFLVLRTSRTSSHIDEQSGSAFQVVSEGAPLGCPEEATQSAGSAGELD